MQQFSTFNFIALIAILLFSLMLIASQPMGKFSSPAPPEIQSVQIQSNENIYVYGADKVAQLSSAGIKYFHSDYLGTPRIETNANKNIVASNNQYPFGEALLKSGAERYVFTGKELDKTNLQYFGARFYFSEIGRFTQVDPAGIGYAYAANNPLKFVDPAGDIEVPGFIKNNWRPVATALALGTVTYNLARGDGAFSGTAGKASAAVLTYDTLLSAKVYNILSRDYSAEILRYSTTPTPSRVTREQLKPYTDTIRNSGVKGAEDVAAALEKQAETGLVFGSHVVIPTIHGPEETGLLGPIEELDYYDIPSGSGGITDHRTKLVALAFFSNPNLFPENLMRVAHEGKHLVQGKLRLVAATFFGFPYESPLNRIEEPARDFARDVVNSYYDSINYRTPKPSVSSEPYGFTETIPEP